MRRFAVKLLLLLFIAHFGLILYTHRSLYFSTFDEAYWKDKYEHSQWKLPLSVRTLGDDGLYLYEGYRIIKGGDPTLLNAEVPPLGKYLIGASILAFGNGHWYGFIVNTLTLCALFVLSRKLFRTTVAALTIAVVFSLDPLITSQFTLTMLDSLQLLFLLLTFCLLLYNRPIRAGVAFGLFCETKFPILGPPVGLLVGLYLWHIHKSWKPIIGFFTISALSYILPYSYYFALGHTFSDWLAVQKWIASFYAHANLTPNVASSITALMTGWYQNLFSKLWVRLPEWTPVWTIVTPLALVSSLSTLRNIYRKKESIFWLPIAGFTAFSLVFFGIIPFWVRYLVLPLALYYIMAAKFLVHLRLKTISYVVFSALVVQVAVTTTILFPSAQRMLTQLSYDWQYGFFHDIYEATSARSRTLSRNQFRALGQKFFAQAEIEAARVTFDTQNLPRFAKSVSVPATVTYYTRSLGSFTETKTITVEKENGQWKIPWDWSYLVNGLTPVHTLDTGVDFAKRGAILASDKTPLAQDAPSVMIWATPGSIDKSREEELLKLLWNLFDHHISHIAFHQRIVGNTQPDIPVPLGVLYKPQTPEFINLLESFPGITLTPALARVYGTSTIVTIGNVRNSQYFECCSWLYTTTTYDGIDGIEKERNSELKGINGGTLIVRDARGAIVRTILDISKKDGRDVQL